MSVIDANTLPGGWDQVRVGDALGLQNGWAFKANEWTTDGRPIIRIQNLKSPDATFNHFNGVLPEKFAAQRGDLLYAWSGTPGTSFGAHIWDGPDAWINQHIFRVDFSDEQFDRDFLKMALDINTRAYIEQAQGGVGLAHITKAKLNESILPVPPLAQQRSIAAAVHAIEAKRQSCGAHLSGARRAIERFRRAVLAAACSGRLTADWREFWNGLPAEDTLHNFLGRRYHSPRGRRSEPFEPGELPEIPDSWVWTDMDSLAADRPYALKAGPFGSSLTKAMYSTSGYKIYGQEQVIRGDAGFDTYFIGGQKFRELESCAVVSGDVLISLVGTIGKVLVLPDDPQPGIINPRLIKISLERTLILPEFTKLILESPLTHAYYQRFSQGSTMEILNLAILRGLSMPLPPLDEQAEIVKRVDRLLSVARALTSRVDAASKRVDRSSQAVLAKAFRGELVVTR